MMRDFDIIGTAPARPRPADDLGPLFAGSADPAPRAPETPAERKARLDRLRAQLQGPIVELAERRAVYETAAAGVTADDVITRAKVLPDAAGLGQDMRDWSWVGPWLSGLADRGILGRLMHGDTQLERRSKVHGKHGNPRLVYTSVDDHRSHLRQRRVG